MRGRFNPRYVKTNRNVEAPEDTKLICKVCTELPENSPRFLIVNYKLNHRDGRVSYVSIAHLDPHSQMNTNPARQRARLSHTPASIPPLLGTPNFPPRPLHPVRLSTQQLQREIRRRQSNRRPRRRNLNLTTQPEIGRLTSTSSSHVPHPAPPHILASIRSRHNTKLPIVGRFHYNPKTHHIPTHTSSKPSTWFNRELCRVRTTCEM